jgi:hypothetical protein
MIFHPLLKNALAKSPSTAHQKTVDQLPGNLFRNMILSKNGQA